jgi:glycosyltransferase involved in cell wall biosynthesis
MLISVVIPAYNAEKTIARCVQEILNSCSQPTEIIVVDDGSSDNTEKVLQEFSCRIKIIRQKNQGPAAARNTGAKAASGEVIVFTDSDTIPEADWLSEIRKAFTDKTIKAAAGCYNIANSNSKLSQVIQQELEQRYMRYKNFIKFGGTYNLAVSKNEFNKVDGFDTSYTAASGEDNDFCYKLLKNKVKIKFLPKAKVKHFHTESPVKYLKEQYRHGYWRAKLYATHPSKLAGDDYTYWKDMIEPPLCLLTLSALPFLACRKQNLKIAATLSLTAFITALSLIEFQQVFNFKLSLPNRLFAAFIMFFRAFARTIGFIHGILNFYGRTANEK